MPPPRHDDESNFDDEVLVKRIKKLKQVTKSRPKQMQVRFDPYLVTLYISPDKRIEIISMDVHLALALPIGGRKVEEFYGRKPKDAKYNEFLDAWRKNWNLQDGTPKLSQMPQYVLSQTDAGDSFKRNFVLHMVSCFLTVQRMYIVHPILPRMLLILKI
ncbi:hypothetical protein Cgig2_028802 [Carnegiea gigantea]|uniref:Uncharacterized protein n=1 Tax=Carnegiea gigantea TaxID=171969 RepID=A0A9Q1GIL6_9CARY|nr:hypothetical protein Cgig2_028802 [Carnegiea gigantea]